MRSKILGSERTVLKGFERRRESVLHSEVVNPFNLLAELRTSPSISHQPHHFLSWLLKVL